jgi:hypothetical protein
MRTVATILPALIAGSFEHCQSVGIDSIVGDAITETERDDASEVVAAVGSDDDENLRLLDQGPAGDWDGQVGADWDNVGAAIARAVRAGGAPARMVKKEELPIPETTLTAGQVLTFTVSPTRAMTVDAAFFDDFLRDHGWVKLISIDVGGHNELNGSGGVFLTQHGDRQPLALSGKKVVANQPVNITVANADTVSSRKLRGRIVGRAA